MLRNRLILAALWILSLICISFYGGPASYGFFAAVTLIPVVSLLYLLLVLSRFKIYQYFECPEIVSNHIVPFYFTLQNEDLFAFSGVRVSFYSDFSSIEGLSDDIEYELLPKTRIKKETGLICRYRGEYLVGIRSVTLCDYLRLFKITYNNKEPLRVTVIPDIIRIDGIKSFETDSVSDRENTASLSRPDVTVRDYIAGDDIRRINWKQTARLGKLTVRNYIGEEKDGIGLIVDTERTCNDINGYLPVENRILEIAIALSLFIKDRNIPVYAYTFLEAVSGYVIDSADTFNSFYRTMSSVRFESVPDRAGMYAAFTSYKEIYSKRIVFIITALADSALKEFARNLNDAGVDVITYLVKNIPAGTSETDAFFHTKIITVPAEGNLEDIL